MLLAVSHAMDTGHFLATLSAVFALLAAGCGSTPRETPHDAAPGGATSTMNQELPATSGSSTDRAQRSR